MKRLLKRWLGIERLEEELEALIKHYGIKLEPQPRYKIKEPKTLGFNQEKKS